MKIEEKPKPRFRYSTKEVSTMKSSLKNGVAPREVAKLISSAFNRPYSAVLTKVYEVRRSLNKPHTPFYFSKDNPKVESPKREQRVENNHEEESKSSSGTEPVVAIAEAEVPVKTIKRMILIDGISIEFEQLSQGQKIEFFNDHIRVYFK